MKHNEQQQTGNPKPSGNLAYYNSIEEACTAYSLDSAEWSYYLFGIGDEPI